MGSIRPTAAHGAVDGGKRSVEFMKRLLGLVLALCVLACLLCGCGKKEQETSSGPASSAASSSAPASSAPAPIMAKAVKIDADPCLNIRSEPSTDGEILGTADNGSMLPLLVEKPSDGWYQVEYEGKSAYVSAEYAQVQEITLDQYNKLKQGSGAASSEASSPAGSAVSSGAGDTDPQRPVSSQPKDDGSSSKSPSSEAAGGAEDGE